MNRWLKGTVVAVVGLALGFGVNLGVLTKKPNVATASDNSWLVFKEKARKEDALKELGFKDRLMLPASFPIPGATAHFITPNLDKNQDPKITHLHIEWDNKSQAPDPNDHQISYGSMTVTPLRNGETVQFTAQNDQTVETPWGSALLKENGAVYVLFLKHDRLLYQLSLNKESLVKHMKEKDGLSDEQAKTKAKQVFLDFVKSLKKVQ